MTVAQVLKELKEMGDERAIRVWTKMGMDVSTYYGVGLTKLKAYAKRVGKSHDLAMELWKSGIHDARLLATMVDEPKKVTEEQIDAWISDVDFWDLSDQLCRNLIAKTTFGPAKMREWIEDEREYVRRSGYILMSGLAAGDKVPDEELAEYVDRIEQSIHGEENWVREAMNYAIIGIGGNRKGLHRKTLAAAKRIGTVDVDYGDTSCQVPDAIGYLSSDRVKAKLA